MKSQQVKRIFPKEGNIGRKERKEEEKKGRKERTKITKILTCYFNVHN